MELFRKAFCAAAAAFIVAGCSVKEQFQEEDQGRKYYGSINVELSYGVTRSSLQTGPDGKSVVWDMSDKFRIYNVADASFVEVSPSSISSDGFTATLPLPYPTGKDISMVVTYGGTEFRSDSTVTAASPIEQGLYTEGHNCNAMPMASSIIPLVSDTPSVTLTPLGALVEVEFLRIPNSRTDKIRNIHILTKAVRGTRSNQLTCDAYCYKVGLDGFSLELEDYMSDKYVFDGEYAAYDPDVVVAMCIGLHLPPWLSRLMLDLAGFSVKSYGPRGYYGEILDCCFMDTIPEVQEYLRAAGYPELKLQED